MQFVIRCLIGAAVLASPCAYDPQEPVTVEKIASAGSLGTQPNLLATEIPVWASQPQGRSGTDGASR